MARTRTRAWATVAAIALVVAAVAVGAFATARTYRTDHRARPAPPSALAPLPTPAAVLGATLPPSPAPTTGSPAPPAAAGRLPVPGKVQAQLAAALAAAALGPSVHAYIADANTGTALVNRGGALASAPASTTKLTTAAAVLTALPVTERLTTRVVAGTRPGQIVLIGGGDPTLSAAPAGKPTRYAEAARISDLAAQVTAALGAGAVTSIVVDTSRFSGPREAPGWAPEDVPSDYASAITALMVDGGLPADGGDIRSAAPELEAGKALAERLGVPGAAISAGVAPSGARPLARVESAPVLELLEQMLATSDNVIAEMLARQVALAVHQPASFAGAVVAVRSVLASTGIVLPATLVDGSGLSAEDRLSPAFLIGLLRRALTQPRLAQLISGLPVAGWDGTLAARYLAPASSIGAGEVRAKTGTLTGVVTLAGVARDRTGRLLVFAVMTDQVPVDGTAAAESGLDSVIARLVACGCG